MFISTIQRCSYIDPTDPHNMSSDSVQPNMFIRFHGFVNPITHSPVKSHIPTQIPVKFLPAECQSVQAYPFKTTEGELATMICLSLLQALEKNKERETEGEGGLLSFIQHVWDLLYPKKKNILQIMKARLADLGNASDCSGKQLLNGEEPQVLTKDTF